MGAWGPGLFENDDAEQLLDEVAGGGGLETLVAALDRVLDTGNGYLEAVEAAQGLAAADIVSRLRARNVPADSGSDMLQRWLEDVDFFAGAATVNKARLAVERIAQKPCELLELWTERGRLDARWSASVLRTVQRLL